MPIRPVVPAILRALLRRAETAEVPAGNTHASHSTPTARRHFFNLAHSQTYATFFPLWGGWASAGHCLTETGGALPPFAKGDVVHWPDGLDAALIGCALPPSAPAAPTVGRRVRACGYPAGSRHEEVRHGAVYFERQPGQWIVQMDDADEPVVTGMSGGPVVDAESGEVLGILITRNSPADLDRDGDADESFDFTALRDVWEAVRNTRTA